jgi:3-dehydroquinate synthase II
MKVVSDDGDLKPGRDVIEMKVTSKADEEAAAKAPHNIILLLDMKDWTVIPLENLVAQRGNIYVYVSNEDEVNTMLGILEKGVDGVVLKTTSPDMVRRVVKQVHNLSPKLKLVTAAIKRVQPCGMGDRVCLDTCSAMTIGEGMLVGNTSSAFFLVHSETIENPYVAARPFRINASALHAYLLMPDGKTAYLSDLKTGDDLMAVDAKGNTRVVCLGRCKIETRPMLLVVAEAEGKEITLQLQNAETINLVKPDGSPISVAKLMIGDPVLTFLQEGGRHFGMKIAEKLIER